MTLGEKVKKSKEILLAAGKKFGEKLAVAWTGGKDSTVLLHLVKTTFDNRVPFPVFFNDSTMEFEQIYDFVQRMTKEWKLDVKRVKHLTNELKEFKATDDYERKKELSRTMKISALNHALKLHGWKALAAGIRWDEHPARSKEEYFSVRKGHVRVHPILHFTENDIWDYIKKFKVPYVSLYDKGYRSLGEKPFTRPAKDGGDERSGREHDKEKVMARLRKLGYY